MHAAARGPAHNRWTHARRRQRDCRRLCESSLASLLLSTDTRGVSGIFLARLQAATRPTSRHCSLRQSAHTAVRDRQLALPFQCRSHCGFFLVARLLSRCVSPCASWPSFVPDGPIHGSLVCLCQSLGGCLQGWCALSQSRCVLCRRMSSCRPSRCSDPGGRTGDQSAMRVASTSGRALV